MLLAGVESRCLHKLLGRYPVGTVKQATIGRPSYDTVRLCRDMHEVPGTLEDEATSKPLHTDYETNEVIVHYSRGRIANHHNSGVLEKLDDVEVHGARKIKDCERLVFCTFGAHTLIGNPLLSRAILSLSSRRKFTLPNF